MANYPMTLYSNSLPKLVFTPITGVNAPNQNVQITNTGNAQQGSSGNLYVGVLNDLLSSGGIPLPQGRSLKLLNETSTIYVSTAYSPGTTNSTISSSMTAGTTVFTVGTTANMTVGNLIMIGSPASTIEVASVSGTTATAVTVSTSTLYDHSAGATVRTCTAAFGQVQVNTGIG